VSESIFDGPEPGTPEAEAAELAAIGEKVKRFTSSAEQPGPPPEVERFYWAAIALAGDLETSIALSRGLEVPRSCLNPLAVAALGESVDGPDLVLTDELALRLSLRLPSASNGATAAGAETPQRTFPGLRHVDALKREVPETTQLVEDLIEAGTLRHDRRTPRDA
jgi:hypothetical protein